MHIATEYLKKAKELRDKGLGTPAIEKELGMMADYADKLEMLDYFDAEVGPNKTILND